MKSLVDLGFTCTYSNQMDTDQRVSELEGTIEIVKPEKKIFQGILERCIELLKVKKNKNFNASFVRKMSLHKRILLTTTAKVIHVLLTKVNSRVVHNFKYLKVT